MSKMTAKQIIYLTLAIVGLVVPLYFVSQFFMDLGQLDWGSFMASAFANPAASSMTVDLFIVLLAFIVWMIPEAKELKMQNWWIYPFFSVMVSAAFGIPFFLFMRERHLRSLKAENH